MAIREVPVPALMAKLPRDQRGLPIPVMTMRDGAGRPLFTVNDGATTDRLIEQDRCPLCGNKFHRARWLVGGPLTAFHPNGAFIDPPMHGECMRYALQVCPYLAAPKWTTLGTAELKFAQSDFGPDAIAVATPHHPTPFRERPALFIAVQFIGPCPVHTSPHSGNRMFTPRSYRQVQYWRHGAQLSKAEGEAATVAALKAYAAKLGEPIDDEMAADIAAFDAAVADLPSDELKLLNLKDPK